jgi:hypothetical protein
MNLVAMEISRNDIYFCIFVNVSLLHYWFYTSASLTFWCKVYEQDEDIRELYETWEHLFSCIAFGTENNYIKKKISVHK